MQWLSTTRAVFLVFAFLVSCQVPRTANPVVREWQTRLHNPITPLTLRIRLAKDSLHVFFEAETDSRPLTLKAREIHGTIQVTFTDSTVLEIPLMHLPDRDSLFQLSRDRHTAPPRLSYLFGTSRDARLQSAPIHTVRCNFKIFISANGEEPFVCYSRSLLEKAVP